MDKAFFFWGGGIFPLVHSIFVLQILFFWCTGKISTTKQLLPPPPPNFVPKRTREFCIENTATKIKKTVLVGCSRSSEFTVLVNLIPPPLEKKVDLPVCKNFFDAALKRCSEDHFCMSFSLRKCISGQN